MQITVATNTVVAAAEMRVVVMVGKRGGGIGSDHGDGGHGD